MENVQLLGRRFGVPDMTVNMHTVTIHEAKAKLSKLIEEALSGQEVVIARRNKPLVRIAPLDTNVFLNDENRLLFGIAGLWEIFIKLQSGKLTVDTDDPATFFKSQLQENAVSILGVTLEHAAATLDLPMIHQDPFDRLIIAQALHDRLPVLSSDPVFTEYGVTNLF